MPRNKSVRPAKPESPTGNQPMSQIDANTYKKGNRRNGPNGPARGATHAGKMK
jgi:hypothetical protein